MKIALFITLNLMLNSSAFAGTVYNAYIKQLQVEGIGDPFNTVYLDYDITSSPCSSTRDFDRLEIANNAQQAAALAALMAGKKVTIFASGNCNSGNIETINYIMLKANE